MCKNIKNFLFSALLLAYPLQGAPLTLEVKAESAVLMNAHSGALLFEKNLHEKQHPASTTKIATAIFALLTASDKLGDVVTADQDSLAWVSTKEKRQSNYSLPAYWLEPGYSNIGLKRGESLSLKDLIYGMMIVSGDDASNVIAKYIGGNVDQFMQGVNAYLKSIGCLNTNFSNPHGLYHPEHMTTAYDLAIMTKEALKNPQFCEIVKTARYTKPKTNLQEQTVWSQSNLLLRPGKYFYPNAIGIKTGYIQIAQNTFVAAAEKDGRTLIAVLLKTKERGDMFLDAVKLFDTAFKEPLMERILLAKGPQTFTFKNGYAAVPIETYLEEDIALRYYPAEEPKLSCKLVWDDVKFPVHAGQRVGELLIASTDGVYQQRVELKAKNEVQAIWWKRILGIFSEWTSSQLLAAAAFIAIITAGLVARGRR